jgi:hypothetical protein
MASVATVLLLVTITPVPSQAEKDPISVSPTTEKESMEFKALKERLNEIKAMDRSTMTRAEKKEIRKELRALKKEAMIHHSGGGGVVYISGGLLVLILVLLIIF